MAERKRQKMNSIVKNNFFMIGRIAKYAPMYFVFMIAEGVICGLLNSASALFNYNILNAVGDGSPFWYAVKIIALTAMFYTLGYFFDKWYTCVINPILRKKLHLRMHEELFVKSRSLDISCFDDPEFYNDFVWAMNESDTRAIEVIEDTGKLINRSVSSLTMFGILFSVDIFIGLMLLVSTTITLVGNLIGNKFRFRQNKEMNPLMRKKDYINRVYYLPDYAKEIRVRHADELLMRDYDENTEKIIDVERKYGKKFFVFYGLSWEAIGYVTFFSMILYMMQKLSDGNLPVGGFAASVSIMWSVRWMLIDVIEILAKYPSHSLYIEKYRAFIGMEPKINGNITEMPDFESLELRNISFSYEFSNHPKYLFHDEDHVECKNEDDGNEVLRNVSFTIHKGEKIAIVGYNGAGKTTLIKLIMRFYDVSDGEILYNGINIKNFDPEAYRKAIVAVFQDFKIFAASLAENVLMREYCPNSCDDADVVSALNVSGFGDRLAALEKGIHTHMTREFRDDGTNLSGGESQKVAIARAFVRAYPIMIMDEPSSALDPMAEYNLNRSIIDNTKGKTVIFISHRLSTTRIADRIYMFDTGRLIEEGSHDELMRVDGKYAEMFNLQSKNYR